MGATAGDGDSDDDGNGDGNVDGDEQPALGAGVVVVTPMSEDERNDGNRKLKALFVALVTVSAGLISLQADASTAQTAAALGGGFVVSLVLLWYLSRTLAEFGTTSRQP